VLWEALCGRRLFQGASLGEICGKVQRMDIPLPSSLAPGVSKRVDEVTMRALERDPDDRYQTAREFAMELEKASPMTTARELGEWVVQSTGEELQRRTQMVAEIESVSTDLDELSFRSVSQAPPRPSRMPPPPNAGATVPEGRALRTKKNSERTSPASLISQVLSTDVPRTSPETPASTAFRSNGPNPLAVAIAAFLVAGTTAYVVLEREAPRLTHGLNSEALSAATRQLEPAVVKLEQLPPADPEPAAPPTEPAPTSKGVPQLGLRKTPPAKGNALVPRPKPVPAAKPATNCEPPWTVDKAGIRRPKPECL
jgi:eukaryotic-like serine/threonine-protein kinase